LVLGGSLGAAEAYIRGFWTCDNLVDLVRVFCRNAAASAGLEGGPARILSPLARIGHWLKRNTPSGSRQNIAAHYDLGNDFFSLFLDQTMAYSCAIFPHAESSLHEASVAKFDRICQKLALTADDHVLEIGTGWGGFALHAAREHGCRITTTTISRKQFEYSRQQVAAAGLSDRVTVLCEDYRALRGSFDKLVSIEMIEAVGERYWPVYFATLKQRLAGHGRAVLQAITVPDAYFPDYRKTTDYIRHSTFPGGMLLCDSAIASGAAQVGMKVENVFAFGGDYARTCRMWAASLTGRRDRLARLGYGGATMRHWQYYLEACAACFAVGRTDVVQLDLSHA
jgi:cyclopropane-fatty-acyl-phospholipid synthase